MIVYPAVDLRAGQCVRLRQGEAAEQTVYDDDPVAVARRWVAEGAEWLHIVNLDGAFDGMLRPESEGLSLPANLVRLGDIIAAVDVPVQFGGGVRSLDDIAMLLELGASRIILGTIAVEQPELVSAAVERFGQPQIAVGLDARDGLVATHGWQQTSHLTAVDLGRQMAQRGIETVIYTDIARDGMLSGVNVSATASLAMQTGLQVIASGGVSSIEDVRALCEVAPIGIAGVIIGSAIYTGDVRLPEAIAAARGA
jgi:phosphoribosylformimino-5-aminoimidazole carboxamide ribotide isomerase